MYSLDFNLLVQRLIRWTMRKPFVLAYLGVLVAPLVSLWAEFETVYLQLDTALSQASIQTDVLQAYLRLLYPAVGSYQVYIANNDIDDNYSDFLGEHHLETYDYFLSENEPPQYETFLNEDGLPYEYTVIVPTAYSSNTSNISNTINIYRPSGKRFNLIFQDL